MHAKPPSVLLLPLHPAGARLLLGCPPKLSRIPLRCDLLGSRYNGCPRVGPQRAVPELKEANPGLKLWTVYRQAYTEDPISFSRIHARGKCWKSLQPGWQLLMMPWPLQLQVPTARQVQGQGVFLVK